MSYIQCQLWMGSLESYMTENFILAAFRKMGEDPQAVKLMRNKYTGEPAGYCFVSFKTDEAAIDAMHKLNGKPIPGTNPLVRFRLNSATNNQNKALLADREFSVWVGDLSSDVDDYSLYRVFSAKYTSIKTAKVILDSSGFSKGYGFVKFGLEDEQKNALYEMNGFIGLGSKPLKICNAVPKPKSELNEALGNGTGSSTTAASLLGYGTAATDYSQYYDPSSYWQNYSAWQGYYDAAGTTADAYAAYQQMPSAQATVDSSAAYAQQQQAVYEHHQHHHHAQIEDEELTLVDHKFTLDIDKLNREVMERDRNLYDALESSKWMPVEQLEIF